MTEPNPIVAWASVMDDHNPQHFVAFMVAHEARMVLPRGPAYYAALVGGENEDYLWIPRWLVDAARDVPFKGDSATPVSNLMRLVAFVRRVRDDQTALHMLRTHGWRAELLDGV